MKGMNLRPKAMGQSSLCTIAREQLMWEGNLYKPIHFLISLEISQQFHLAEASIQYLKHTNSRT